MDEELHEAGRRAQDRRDREGGSPYGAEDGDGDGAGTGGSDAESEEAEAGDAESPPAARREGQPDGTHGEVGGGTHRVESTARTPPRRRHGYNKDDDLVTKQVCEMAETEEDPDVRANLKKRCRKLRQE